MWNDRYAKPGYLFGTEPAQYLRGHKTYLRQGVTALAVADGEGRNSVFMARQGVQVTAMDSADVAVEKAQALAKAAGVEVDFNVADIGKWDWGAKAYDLVVGVFIQFVGPEGRAAQFEGMKIAVKPGGHILLHGYTPKQLEFGTGGPPFVENLYTEEMLREAFSDFEIVELHAYEREIDEGAGHSGMSALIDLVARKPLG
ncbi:MAG: methyltransferase domain-containing protein [Rhodobacteraceae bacterium]|nr:methyltransferase domain-containing protein [Paracoccaceae bacterium]